MTAPDLLIFGAGVFGMGVLMLGAVVYELRPQASGAGALMGVGLGLGVLAFGAKLLLIIAFGLLGDEYLARFLPRDLEPETYRPHRGQAERTTSPEVAGYAWESLPRAAPAPRDNPTTEARVKLGERLFNDPNLSLNGEVSCASCHDLAGGGADGQPVSVGIHGQRGTRNAPTVINAAYQAVLFWDGRAASLEAQAKGPLINPLEMGMPNLAAVVERVVAVPEYRQAFAHAFGGEDPITIDNIAKAIAAFERTLITPDTPYDRFVRGDRSAMTGQQIRGMALFAEFGCTACHRGPNFSDASLIGGAAPFRVFPAVTGTEYESRYRLAEALPASAEPSQRVWRIPSLRNVTKTAPYFHNGSVTDLAEAVRIMARVQLAKPYSASPGDDWEVVWDPAARTTTATPNATISDTEVEDIVAFLHALEGDIEFTR